MHLNWQNGQPYSSRFGDVYFSADSGLAETRHVFLQGNRLEARFAALSAGECFTIGETGFGTGLNFLCTWRLFEKAALEGTSLDFFSTEKFPLNEEELRSALALWPELGSFAELLLDCWRRRVPGWNRWSFAGGRVRLTLAIDDVAEVLPQLPDDVVDAWFLDGFSPAKNPEMWGDQVLSEIARASRSGATLATYTCAGWVRRGLLRAGFAVRRTPGYGRKREMLCGELSRHTAKNASRRTLQTALVIGGGVAGCAVAHALAVRGVAVTLLERAPQLASAASGNPRGILHARFGAGVDLLHRFVLAAYGHALGLFDEVLPVDGKLRSECGLLQLDFSPKESKRISRLAEREWPVHLLRLVDAAQASELTGIQMAHGGVWFPGAGWIVPHALCARLATHVSIEQRLSHTVEALIKTDTGWRAVGREGQGETWTVEADAVVVCCAHSARALEQFAQFPLTPVRGQITLLPATASSQSLRAVVCGEGYCSPALAGVHVTGATHAINDDSLDVRESDHADNLAKLAAQVPYLHKALGEIAIAQLTGRAAVRCSAPGSMPLVGRVQEGLYCSLAHGTRGLITAGLSGEMISATMCDQLLPFPIGRHGYLSEWKWSEPEAGQPVRHN